MSVAGSVVGGIVDSSGVVDGGITANEGEPYTPVERVTNGAFASGASWTITGSAWTISGGVATSTGNAGTLQQALVTSGVLRSGGAVTISVDVTNALEGNLEILAYRSGVEVQSFYSSIPVAGTLSISTTADAEWDTIVFNGGVLNFTTGTLDNVSVIA